MPHETFQTEPIFCKELTEPCVSELHHNHIYLVTDSHVCFTHVVLAPHVRPLIPVHECQTMEPLYCVATTGKSWGLSAMVLSNARKPSDCALHVNPWWTL